MSIFGSIFGGCQCNKPKSRAEEIAAFHQQNVRDLARKAWEQGKVLKSYSGDSHGGYAVEFTPSEKAETGEK